MNLRTAEVLCSSKFCKLQELHKILKKYVCFLNVSLGKSFMGSRHSWNFRVGTSSLFLHKRTRGGNYSNSRVCLRLSPLPLLKGDATTKKGGKNLCTHTPDAYTPRIPTQENRYGKICFSFFSFLIFFCREMNKSGVDTCARLLCTMYIRRNVHPRCYSFFGGGGKWKCGKERKKKRGKGRKQTGVRHANLLRKRKSGRESGLCFGIPPPFLSA